jgi:hypothetical protein
VKECTYPTYLCFSHLIPREHRYFTLESGVAHATTSGPRLSGRLDRRNYAAYAFEMTGFIVGGGVGDEAKSGQSAKLQPSLQG